MKHSQTVVSLFLFSLSLNASDNIIIASLFDDMINTSQIATQTNQNIDYQPFILSVLQADDLSKLGIKTLGEALTLVPGVDMATDTINNRTPIVRGSNPLAYGQTKLLINGIVVNDRTFDSYNAYLDLPIELIDRIEVVRGSGSFIDGVNGYAGTINVITYSSQTKSSLSGGQIFGSIGNNQNRSIGFWDQYVTGNWKLSTDLLYQSNDLQSPLSVQGSSRFGPSPRGFANLASEHFGIGMSLEYESFILQGRINNYQSGSAFGNFDILPNQDGIQTIDSWYVQGEFQHPLSDDLKLNIKTRIMEDGWESNSRSIQPIPGFWDEGYWGILELKNRLLEGGITTEYSGIENHLIKGGYTLKYESAIDISSVTTIKTGGTSLVDYTNTLPFFNAKDAKRHIQEFYLSDNISVNNELALALMGGGIKSDHMNTNWYGRAALVYQPFYNHIFKTMVGNSYRLPSWQEMYVANNPARIGNPDLNPEHVISYEGQYLYKIHSQLTMGINLFHLTNSDQIVRDSNNKFQNSGKNHIVGGEAELRGKLTPNDNGLLSYSYINGKVSDKSGGEHTLPYAASHLVKAAYSYDFMDSWTIGTVWNYIGCKERYTTDNRDALQSYNTLDIVLGWNMDTKNGWYLQGSVKNIGNEIVRYPAPMTVDGSNNPITSYADDYPVAARSFLIRSGWRF